MESSDAAKIKIRDYAATGSLSPRFWPCDDRFFALAFKAWADRFGQLSVGKSMQGGLF
jgi:hypothetical protein